MSTIELRRVTKRFGSFVAVRDVDLSVAAGEVVCLLGPSGCGKTTTLRIIAGLERASAGDVVIAGRRMNELRPEQRDIAMVFQFYALYPALTVRENIMFPLHCERLDPSVAAERSRRSPIFLQIARSARPAARPHFGRGKAAGGRGPRGCSRPQLFPVRRAPVAPRRRAAPIHARADQDRADRSVQSDRHRHPRSTRGPDHGRPHRHHARRPASSRWPRRTRSSPSLQTSSWRASSARRR